MYHYTASGLDNIYLINGYRVRDTAAGRAVAVEDLEGLHGAIADALVQDKPHLTGPEFRFLRKYLEMTQRRVGTLAGVDEQSVRYWERLGRLPKWADHWIRNIYSMKIGDPDFEALIDRLNEMDRRRANLAFEYHTSPGDGWHVRAV